MKKREIETFLYSVVGVAALVLILVAFNFIVGRVTNRVDLTDEKLYTLSEGTRTILKKLPGPVEVRFYASQGEEMPVQLKAYAQQVEDLLREYRAASGGKIALRKIDPKPDTDDEDRATLDGIEGQALATGARLYMGVAVNYADARASLPFLAPDRGNLLEYDISRAISQVTSENKSIVGIMSSLPVFGQQANPMMARMGQQAQDPLVFVSELKRDFTVREVPTDTAKIDDDINELLVVHPKELSDQAQFAIDQYLLRGGKLVVLVDPLAVMDRSQNPSNPMMPSMPGSSNLEKLFKAWGITFETGKVVADMQFARQLSFQQGQPPQLMPAFLFINPQGIAEDVVTSHLDNLWLPFAGSFSGTPADGLEKAVLLHSTTNSQLVDGFLAQMSGESIAKDFKASGKQYELAIRLSGKFKTAFPDGKPKAPEPNQEEADTPPEPADTGPALKESTQESTVTLLGDADFIFDEFCVQRLPFGKMYMPRNGNLTFVQNIVEQLAGDNNLIAVRSRATLNRPFTVVREIESRAEEKHRAEIKRVEEKLQETQRRINELQAQKAEGNQRFILSPEQQAELQKFKGEEREAKLRLREVTKARQKEIDSLENRVKWWNIAGMPALVIMTGISVALVKRQRTRAR